MGYNNWGAASYVHSGEKWKTRTTSRSKMPVWTVSQRFSRLQWRRLFIELCGRPTTTADFRSPLWQVPYTSNVRLLEDKVQDRGIYLFAISYGSDAMDQRNGVGWFSGWIEIFVIYSWYFKCRTLSDARIASALNTIIHNFHFRRRIRLEEQKAQKQDRFLRGTQIAYLIYDHFWVTGSHDTVENYTDLFTSVLRNDDIQDFDSKWDGISLSMTKIPPDEILEELYKLRTWESEKLETVLELYDLETHQKKLEPDYHRLKKRWWREVSSRKFEIILGAEMEILWRTPWSRIREQNSVYKEFLEIVGNGKPTGSVWKGTIAVSTTKRISVEKLHHQILLRILSCSRMSENHWEPEVPEAEAPAVERLDGLARITLEELAITHFLKNSTLQNACSTRPRVVVGLVKSAHSHTVRLMNSRREGLKRMMTKVQWLCWRREIGKKENLSPMNVTIDLGNLGRRVLRNWDKIHLNVNYLMHGNRVVYFRTWRRRSLFSGRALTCRSQSNVWNSKRLLHITLKFETKILRSDLFAQVHLISVAPTIQNLRIVHKKRQSGKSKVPAKQRGSWPKKCSNLKEHQRVIFFSPSENRCLPASTLKPEEREFVVDSGASMHMIRKKDLSDAEMDTLTKSCSPTIVITANGEVRTFEEATVYVKEIGFFLTMKVLDNTPAVLSLGKLFDESGYSYERIMDQRSKTTSH